MPKSGKNARPYNRSQKRAAKRNNSVLKKATKAGMGKSVWSGTGPGRKHTSPGQSAQATRELGMYADKVRATKLKNRRGKK